MAKCKLRAKGDIYRPVIKVNRAKNGIPTSIELGGNKYALVLNDYMNGNKNKVKNRRKNI